MKFPLGKVYITPGALRLLHLADKDPIHYLLRHSRGDWGDLDSADIAENELSLKKGFRLLSSYNINDLNSIWIITEYDRSSTTILLPDEY